MFFCDSATPVSREFILQRLGFAKPLITISAAGMMITFQWSDLALIR